MAVSVAVLLMSGCASGRFHALRIDKRTPEQIEASKTRDTIVYTCSTNTPVVEVQSPPRAAFPWTIIIDFLKVLDGVLEVGSVEWKNK